MSFLTLANVCPVGGEHEPELLLDGDPTSGLRRKVNVHSTDDSQPNRKGFMEQCICSKCGCIYATTVQVDD